MNESIPRVALRPIHGGAFGFGRYALASIADVAHGLQALRFAVIEPRDGRVLSIANDRVEALAAARQFLTAAGDLRLAANEVAPEQAVLFPELANAERVPAAPVSRRRRDVHERASGRCHYCAAEIPLDGAWHVEHMKPRALGGTDDAMNLVAACEACNLEKRDRTALEFALRARHTGDKGAAFLA